MYSPVSKTKKVLQTPKTLTSSYVQLADTNIQAEDKAVKGALINQLALAITYTADAGATLPVLKLKMEYATIESIEPPTAVTSWYPEQIELAFAVSGTEGQSTLGDRVYLKAGTPGTAVRFYFPVPITALWARVMSLETVSAGSNGTITCDIVYGQT